MKTNQKSIEKLPELEASCFFCKGRETIEDRNGREICHAWKFMTPVLNTTPVEIPANVDSSGVVASRSSFHDRGRDMHDHMGFALEQSEVRDFAILRDS